VHVSDAIATVIVVNWNGASLLPDCLDGLARQRGDVAFETWVVDNASTDESRELLRTRYPQVRVLESDVNRGFAGGNNFALREVTTPFAVLLNNDAVPEPDWLQNLLAPMREPGTGRIGATTGKVLFAPRFVRLRLETEGFVPEQDARELGVRIFSVAVTAAPGAPREELPNVLWERLTYGAEGPAEGRYFWTRPAGEMFVPVPAEGAVDVTFGWAAEREKTVHVLAPGSAEPSELRVGVEPGYATLRLAAGFPRTDVVNNVGGIVIGEGYGADRGYQEIDVGQYDTSDEVFTACGNGLAMRREVGEQLGWFDEDFFLYYEDTDLSWRARSLGYAIRYVPDAVLRHLHSATSEEWSPLFVFHVDRNRLLMLTKNATAPLAARAVLHYPLTTVSMFLRACRQAVSARRRPPLRPTLLRLRVIGSYLRLLPRMLARRAQIGGRATVSRSQLQRTWIQAVRPVPGLDEQPREPVDAAA
jgi:GT2 family glycosyltransferase